MPIKTPSRAEKYIADVMAGKIVTSKLVRLACERHRRELTDSHLRNLKFSRKQAEGVIAFIESFTVCR
jgi:phage terminase large subunit-like protein